MIEHRLFNQPLYLSLWGKTNIQRSLAVEDRHRQTRPVIHRRGDHTNERRSRRWQPPRYTPTDESSKRGERREPESPTDSSEKERSITTFSIRNRLILRTRERDREEREAESWMYDACPVKRRLFLYLFKQCCLY